MLDRAYTVQKAQPHPYSELLAAYRLPGRLTADQVGAVTGFATHDIPVLDNEGLTEPLGNPARSAVKYYAAVDILAKAQDPKWLAKATNAIYGKWRRENGKRRKRSPGAVETAPATERVAA